MANLFRVTHHELQFIVEQVLTNAQLVSSRNQEGFKIKSFLIQDDTIEIWHSASEDAFYVRVISNNLTEFNPVHGSKMHSD